MRAIIAATLTASAISLASASADPAASEAAFNAGYLPEVVPEYAIVIYEANYTDKSLDPDAVSTSQRDGEHVAAVLSDLRISTLLLRDPKAQGIRDAVKGLLDREVQQVRNGGGYPTVLIFFTGHGFRVDGEDYILPSDFDAVKGETSALRISDLALQIAPLANLFIFSDACRTRGPASVQEAGRSIDDYAPDPPGSAAQQVPARAAPSGTSFPPDRFLVSYAARPDRPAFGYAHVGDPESPYAGALAKTLAGTGIDVKLALSRVTTAVKGATLQRQTPVYEDEGAGAGDFFLKPAPSDQQKAEEKWRAALQSGRLEDVEQFINENAWSPYLKAALRRRAEMSGRDSSR